MSLELFIKSISQKPFLILKELIVQKYGEEKFAFACEIVSQWVMFECKGHTWFTPEKVQQLCCARSESEIIIFPEEWNALHRLFGWDLLFQQIKIRYDKNCRTNAHTF